MLRLVTAIVLGLGAEAARATTAADLCAPSADPCVVSTTIAVANGSTIDLGTRELQIGHTGTLDVGGGSMTIVARVVRLVGGALKGHPGAGDGGSITIQTTDDFRMEAS